MGKENNKEIKYYSVCRTCGRPYGNPIKGDPTGRIKTSKYAVCALCFLEEQAKRQEV